MAIQSISATEVLPRHMHMRNEDELDLEQPTDDATLENEIASAKNKTFNGIRMAARLRDSIRSSIPKNEVSLATRHERERLARDIAAREALDLTSGMEAHETGPPVMRKRRVYSSTVRCLAEALDTDPSNITWNAITAGLPSGQVMSIIRDCADAIEPAEQWNSTVRSMEPVSPGCMRVGTTQVVYLPGTEQACVMRGLQPLPKKDNNSAASAWIKSVEAGSVEGRLTMCEFSGKSLIERGRIGGGNYWRLMPDFQGLGIDVAREVVSAAAIIAGIIPGQINGSVPPLAQKLATDGDAWCGLVLATKHPLFYKIAKAMVRLRDKHHWLTEDTNMRNNLAAWHRVVNKAA